MEPDGMSVRLHLRRIRVAAVLVDVVEELVVDIAVIGKSRDLGEPQGTFLAYVKRPSGSTFDVTVLV